MTYKRCKNRKLQIGIIIMFLLFLCAIFIPLFSKHSYRMQDASARNLGSSFVHLFGTDKFGRDIFVRVWYGLRISMFIGLASTMICAVLGIIIGVVSGYIGGKIDLICMRIADVMDSIPSLLYMILITLVLGANTGSVLFGICVSGWTELARIVRGETLRVKRLEYCSAARLLGLSRLKVICNHVLPNIRGTIIVSMTFFAPKAIFMEAFLSFLGIGISAPMASLGTMIQDARSQMRLYPMQMLYPILILCILILAWNLIGLGLEQEVKQ